MASAGVVSATIPPNQALSDGIDLGANTCFAFEMPEAWAGTALTFQSKANLQESGSGGTTEDWDNVYDDNGTELSVTVAADRVVGLRRDQASVLSGIRFLRIRSGTSAAPVNQNPQRIIKVLVKQP